MNRQTSSFLVIGDDLLARSMAAAAPTARILTARHVADARALLQADKSICGVVLDEAASNSPGLAARELRRDAPLLSLLFVATRISVQLINDLQPLRVQLVVRPLPAAALSQFAERAMNEGRLTDHDLHQWVLRFASEQRLSRHDVALVPVVLEQETPEHACERLGMERADLDRGLRRIVKKCRVRNTDRLARNLLRDALLASRDLQDAWSESETAQAVCF